MSTQYAIEKAAQVWCQPGLTKKEMDVDLAEGFAAVLDAEVERMKDAGEFLWVVVANAGGGDWNKETPEWQKAAAKARDDYHALCSAMNRKTA